MGAGGSIAGWMGRSAVARALDVSVSTVRRLEGTALHPVRAEDGCWYFNPDEVERARTQLTPPSTAQAAVGGADSGDDGDLAARLFPLFQRGTSFAEAVLATH